MAERIDYIISLKDLFSSKLSAASAQVDKFENKVGGLQSSFGGFAAKAAAAFSAYQIFNFAKGIVEVGGNFEAAQIGLTTLLGSAEAAQEVFRNVKEDAAKTPFDVASLLKGNQLLISAGVSAGNARKDILSLGNAVAATGGSAEELERMSINLQQIRNVGHATGLDIKQFAYAGINIYGLLAQATGKTTEEVKDMTVTYDVLVGALAKAGEAGGMYANGLANMSQSTNVQVSNLGDTIMFLKDDLFQALKPAIDAVISSFSGFVGWLRESIVWMQQHRPIVISIVSVLGVVALSWGILNTAIAINNGLAALSAIRISGLTLVQLIAFATTNGLTGAMMALNAAFWANPIGIVVGLVAALVGVFVYLYNSSETARGAMWGLWESVKSIFFGIANMAKTYLSGVGELLIGVFTLDPEKMKSGLIKTFKAVAGFATGVQDSFSKGFDEGVKDFNKKPEEKK